MKKVIITESNGKKHSYKLDYGFGYVVESNDDSLVFRTLASYDVIKKINTSKFNGYSYMVVEA